MKINDNGIVRDMTPEEIAAMQAYQFRPQRSYDDLVNDEIRKRYSVSQEFAVLRQKEEKPDEYAAYFRYCEDCKVLVQSKSAQ